MDKQNHITYHENAPENTSLTTAEYVHENDFEDIFSDNAGRKEMSAAREEMPYPPLPSGTPKAKKKKDRKLFVRLFLPAIFAIMGIAFLLISIRVLTSATSSSFSTELEREKEDTYQDIYQWAFERAERENHVMNVVSISLEGVRETSNLEILRVSDTEYVIEKAENNAQNIESWIRIDGTGIFTVDLSLGEFITDSEQKYVLARVPAPVLTDVKNDVPQLIFSRNDFWNDSYEAGESLTREQIAKGEAALRNKMTTNQFFRESADQAAKQFISSFIKKLNPDIPDLIVDVEFLDEG